MLTTRGTAALVALEDAAPDVLFETLPGTDILVWPLLRWPLASALSAGELGLGSVNPSVTRRQKLSRLITDRLPNPRASRRLGRQADALFVVSGTTLARSPDGRADNWLVQAFAETIADRAIVLQDAPLRESGAAADLPTFAATYTFDDAIVAAELVARATPLSRRSMATVEAAARELMRQLDIAVEPAHAERALRMLRVRANRARYLRDRFARVLDNVQPRVAIVQTAAYGTRSPLIALMKERGITVAEPQHGWIGGAHAAYNYGAAANSAPLRSGLPDVLLTFGTFWSDAVAGPFEKVAIGKPQLDEGRALVPAHAERAQRVLSVSSVSDPEGTSAFTLAVRDALPAGWRVAFRPHPLERPTLAARYPDLVGADRIDIDLDRDVYASLRSSRMVVGDASTVLYEALAMGCAVMVRETAFTDYYIDRRVFPVVVGPGDDLASALRTMAGHDGTGVDAATLESLWASDPRRRFAEFASRY